MKPFKVLFIIAVSYQLLAINYCGAQSFTLIKATSQRWAGGVAGHYGVNYYIELETSSSKIKPDTVWINGEVYPINYSGKDGMHIRSIDSVNHKIKFCINEGESHSDFNRQLKIPADTVAKKPKPIRHFDGVAMISYTLKHKQRFFIVKNFTSLPPLNYP